VRQPRTTAAEREAVHEAIRGPRVHRLGDPLPAEAAPVAVRVGRPAGVDVLEDLAAANAEGYRW
jgi:hypothetical protein